MKNLITFLLLPAILVMVGCQSSDIYVAEDADGKKVEGVVQSHIGWAGQTQFIHTQRYWNGLSDQQVKLTELEWIKTQRDFGIKNPEGFTEEQRQKLKSSIVMVDSEFYVRTGDGIAKTTIKGVLGAVGVAGAGAFVGNGLRHGGDSTNVSNNSDSSSGSIAIGQGGAASARAAANVPGGSSP